MKNVEINFKKFSIAQRLIIAWAVLRGYRTEFQPGTVHKVEFE